MPTTDENKAIRSQQSRQVAQDAAEAYRAAVSDLTGEMDFNREATAALEGEPLPRAEYDRRRRELREEARQLTFSARNLGIERSTVAVALGVSRETVHNWLNGKKW